jgi:peptide chain release factor subunit 1
MATDPVEQIHTTEIDSGFSTDLNASLRDLAKLEPSTAAPYLSVYLDWRPDGERPQHRSALTVFNNRAEKLIGALPDDSPARSGLTADVRRVRALLESSIDPAVHGVIVIANDQLDLFESFVLAIPVETEVEAGPTPRLLQMVRVVEDYPRYAVLVADQKDANLTVINRAARVARVEVRGDDAANHHQQGGWSQRRFQTRNEERRAHFARAIAEETRRALSDGNIDMLVVAAGDVMASALSAEFHESVSECIVGNIHLDIRASYDEIRDATMPIVEEAEKKRELEAVTKLLDQVGAKNRGVVGVQSTLDALVRGQVMTTVMVSDFSTDGWADYEMNLYGVGGVPDMHPAGGDLAALQEVDLAEEIVRLTVVTDAEGEIIHSGGSAAGLLNDHQVGGILRFKMDE